MADSSHCRHRCAQWQCQQTAILYAPSPGGEIIRQSCVGGVRVSVPPNPHHNIIYRDCITGFLGPNPKTCVRFAYNLDYVKGLSMRDYKGISRWSALSGRPATLGSRRWPPSSRPLAHPGLSACGAGRCACRECRCYAWGSASMMAESPPFGVAVLLAASAAGSPPLGTSSNPFRLC